MYVEREREREREIQYPMSNMETYPQGFPPPPRQPHPSPPLTAAAPAWGVVGWRESLMGKFPKRIQEIGYINTGI